MRVMVMLVAMVACVCVYGCMCGQPALSRRRAGDGDPEDGREGRHGAGAPASAVTLGHTPSDRGDAGTKPEASSAAPQVWRRSSCARGSAQPKGTKCVVRVYVCVASKRQREQEKAEE